MSTLALLGAGVLGLSIGWLLGTLRAGALRHELAVKEAELRQRASIDVERERALELASERLRSTFGEVADRQFRASTETFLRLARESLNVQQERAKGDLAAREQAIDSLVRPIRDALIRAETQIQELDKTSRATQGSISTQLEAARRESADAERRDAQPRERAAPSGGARPMGRDHPAPARRARGHGRALRLRDPEPSGHRHGRHSAGHGDSLAGRPRARGRRRRRRSTPTSRPPRPTGDAERRAALERHAAIVGGPCARAREQGLLDPVRQEPGVRDPVHSGRSVPDAALAERPELLDEALRQNIILATPTSFVALLKTVAYGWQQVSLAANAAEIRGLAVQLYERLATFAAHLGDSGKALGDGVKAYNRTSARSSAWCCRARAGSPTSESSLANRSRR